MNIQSIRRRGNMFAKSFLLAAITMAISALGQTASDLAAKYPSVSAYQIRPGILMTAKYSNDGQVCEMVLEARHYQTPEKVDLNTTIPAKLENSLIDELVPPSERGELKNRWSNKDPKDAWLDPDSFTAGGVSYTKRSYENVSIEEHGYYRCHEDPSSKLKTDCSEGGDEVVVIRWNKRACTTPKGAAESAKAKSSLVMATNSTGTVDPKP